ncbi:MAG: 23S rRNA (pseudouridine(1915)-N(3))-methyltransferase RlmH [Bdellovibrionaceae bacterium]|nr:23S rRNA (pseudouridine(1915)-N(3))-methyltransferase RlmH [Bdellovibrionales bacterium]MCB9085516.1 23S rRNA (pseudouridine(1915)-N(3))-methyltransferase RlmH [Pseudobdellovibrionaceae bacterium]
MRAALLFVQTSKDSWHQDSNQVYLEKISRMLPFDVVAVKSDSSGRKEKDRKITAEDSRLLKVLSPDDWVIAFDEKGKTFSSSREFSQFLVKKLEMGKARVVFIIGGAFGLGPEVRARANEFISLSPLTMNHQVASLVALEQIYRALTIWKGIPYHNE